MIFCKPVPSSREPRRHWRSGNDKKPDLIERLAQRADPIRLSHPDVAIANMKRNWAVQSLLSDLQLPRYKEVLECWARGMSQLPNEILSEIFSHVIDGTHSHKPTPVNLVSQRWNEVARHTLAAHRFIRIDGSLSHNAISKALERSRNYSGLEVTVRIPSASAFTTTADVKHALGIAAPTLERWSSLSISTADSYGAIRELQQYLSRPAFALEELTLRFEGKFQDNLSDNLRIPIHLFRGVTPRLRSLDLHAVQLNWRGPLFRGLERLAIDRHMLSMQPTFADLKLISEGSPNLRNLFIGTSGPKGTLPEEPIRFSKLEILEFQSAPKAIAQLLRHLSTPRLVYLKINCSMSKWPTRDVCPPLATLIGETPFHLPLLQSLALHWKPNPLETSVPGETVDMLSRLPNLMSLDIDKPPREALCALSEEHQSGWICPRLSDLQINAADGIWETDLMELIEAREIAAVSQLHGVIRLLSLRMIGCRGFTWDCKFARWARAKIPTVKITNGSG